MFPASKPLISSWTQAAATLTDMAREFGLSISAVGFI